MATRVAVMDAGRLQQVGPPQEVYDRPANAFVAEFIGSPPMNLLSPGLLEPGADRIGVRPEHVRIVAEPEPGSLEAKVTLVEALGHERHVTVAVGDTTTIVARVGAESPVPGEGDTVSIVVEPRHRHRFDATTGERRTP